MEEKIVEALDLIQTKLEENKITPTKYGNEILTYFDKCINVDDVGLLIHYLLCDESGSGIEFAKDVAEKALLKKKSQNFEPVHRGDMTISETAEMIILAESFAKYSKPQDKNTFSKIFKLAHNAAKKAFDYHLLALNLYSACQNIDDPTIDTDFVLTKELIKKSADLYAEDNSTNGIEDLLYMAKNKLEDKDLVKYLTALKKKLKK